MHFQTKRKGNTSGGWDEDWANFRFIFQLYTSSFTLWYDYRCGFCSARKNLCYCGTAVHNFPFVVFFRCSAIRPFSRWRAHFRNTYLCCDINLPSLLLLLCDDETRNPKCCLVSFSLHHYTHTHVVLELPRANPKNTKQYQQVWLEKQWEDIRVILLW